MKSSLIILCLTSTLTAPTLRGQGIFLFDQQSADETIHGESIAGIQVNAPIGQSFTPALASIGFIRLSLMDVNPGNGAGATLLCNLRAGSITGPTLGTTTSVSLPDGYGANFPTTDFFFPGPVALVPGTTYFFDITVLAGDAWDVRRFIPTGNYTGGTEFLQGQPGNNDLWFREGILVPEPSSAAFLLAATGLLVAVRSRRHNKPKLRPLPGK